MPFNHSFVCFVGYFFVFRIAVFKPRDEDHGCTQNPRGTRAAGRPGIHAGEGFQREVAAYLLDHDGFVGVPFTVPVTLTYIPPADKTGTFKSFRQSLGSLQVFVPHQEILENWNRFTDLQWQKLALFDLRICNRDRNGQNALLVDTGLSRAEKYKMVPIDHSLSIPSQPSLDPSEVYWYYVSAVNRPMCPEIVEYIKNIDIEADIQRLRSCLNLRKHCLVTLRVLHYILRRAVDYNLTLYNVATFLSSYVDEEKECRLMQWYDVVSMERSCAH